MYRSTYKVGESVRIGEVVLTVLAVGLGRVRLGFAGTSRDRIYRKEINEAMTDNHVAPNGETK